MKNSILFSVILILGLMSCDSKPTKVEPLNNNNATSSPKSSNDQGDMVTLGKTNSNDNTHEVVVLDTIMTERYLYLNVQEGSRKYWISTWQIPTSIGDKLYYQEGILKLNFYSKEQKKLYDTLYLISRIAKSPFIQQGNVVNEMIAEKKVDSKLLNQNKNKGVSLKKLLSNPESYKGKVLMVSGKCVKTNKNIMGKNWIHIQQQDENGKIFNLVVTSQDISNIGEDCLYEGKLETNLDLGAGYFYDVIVQDAKKIN